MKIIQMTFLLAFTAFGQNDESESAGREESPLQIHGYFNQAIAVSSNNTYLGISEEVTTEYRSMADSTALRFRFQQRGHPAIQS